MRILLFALFFLTNCNSLLSQKYLDLLSTQYNTFFTEINDELWVASAGHGWNRFNGVATQHYSFGDTLSGLKGTFVQSKIYPDQRQRYWSSTYEHLTVWQASKNKFESFKINDHNGKLINNGYHVFHFDKGGNSLFIRDENQIYTLDTDTRKISSHIGQTIANSFCVWQDTMAGAPWMNGEGFELWTRNNGKWSKDIITQAKCPTLFGRRVIKVLHLAHKIWLLTDNGLICYNPNDPKLSKLFLYYKRIRNIFTDGDIFENKIFIGTENLGMLIFDTKNENFIENNFSSYSTIDYIFIDKYNRIITSQATKGITYSYLYQHLFPDIRYSSKSEWNLFEIKNDFRILIENERGIIIQKGIETRTFKLGDKKLPLNIILDAEVLNDDEIIIFGRYDFFKYSWKNNSFKPLNINGVHQFQNASSSKDLIFIIGDNSLTTLDKKSLQSFRDPINSKYKDILQNVCVSTDSMSTYSSASSQYIINRKGIDTIIDFESFVYDAVFIKDIESHFVTTQNGLKKLDRNLKISAISKGHPLLSNLQSKTLCHYKSWIYTHAGNIFYRYHCKTGEIQVFDKWSFSQNPKFAIQNDTIYFALNNMIPIHINDAFGSDQRSKLELSRFEVNHKETSDSQRNFNYNFNNFSWTYYLANNQLGGQSKILYRLLPSDTSWITIDNGQVIEYKFLAPGHYMLEVKGMHSNGQWTKTSPYTFTINPIWYQQTWFFFCSILGLLAGSYYFYRSRIRRLEYKYKIEKEINQLQRSALQAQMNPHFIFNCLNSIQNYIMQNEKLEAMEYLNRFAHLIRQNLQASTENMIRLDDEVSMLENYIALEKMRFDKRFDYTISIADDIDTTTISIPPLLVQPFVENAIIHGVSSLPYLGWINIDIFKVNDKIRITIADNGKGIQKSKTHPDHKSFGMSITQKRLAFINQQQDSLYTIETTSDENGTKITIQVPVE